MSLELLPPNPDKGPVQQQSKWESPEWKKARKVVFAISATFLLGIVLWGINQFLSLRGVVNVSASRVVLAFTVAAAIALVFALTRLLKNKRTLWCAIGIPLVLCSAVLLDRWAPRPVVSMAPSPGPSVETRKSAPEGSEPALRKPESPKENEKPTVVKVTSDVLARIHMRGLRPQPPATEAMMDPQFKELFYEWKMKFIPRSTLTNVLVTLRDAVEHGGESIRIAPTSGVISGPSPEWLSGFVEAKEPDFYVRTIRFAKLERGQPVDIEVRRPIILKITSKTMPPPEFFREASVRADQSTILNSPYSPVKDIPRIARHLESLGNWKNGDKLVPLKINPTEEEPPLTPYELEATIEARCQEDRCEHFLMSQLEARRGKQR